MAMTSDASERVRIPKTFDQVAWTWMRYSAFLLIPLAWGHIILQDVVVGVHNITTDYAIQRAASLGWKVYDILLLGFAFAHGMNGVRQVLRDYIHNPQTFRVVSYLLLLVWLAITALGAVALLLINAPVGM
jgi:succinate dehydrogenase / fumarate reductase membrane anchor subunit